NGGQTWATAGTITGSNLRNPSIVELNDGRLMMLLSHNNVTPRNKLVSYSNDGGATWSAAASYGNGLVTGDFGHMYPSVLAGNADTGELFYVSGLNRGTDARSYNMSPVYANSPTLFSSDNQGQTFSRRGALFDRLPYNTYVVPVGNMDAVVLNTGQVLIETEERINTPYQGIVVYQEESEDMEKRYVMKVVGIVSLALTIATLSFSCADKETVMLIGTDFEKPDYDPDENTSQDTIKERV